MLILSKPHYIVYVVPKPGGASLQSHSFGTTTAVWYLRTDDRGGRPLSQRPLV